MLSCVGRPAFAGDLMLTSAAVVRLLLEALVQALLLQATEPEPQPEPAGTSSDAPTPAPQTEQAPSSTPEPAPSSGGDAG